MTEEEYVQVRAALRSAREKLDRFREANSNSDTGGGSEALPLVMMKIEKAEDMLERMWLEINM